MGIARTRLFFAVTCLLLTAVLNRPVFADEEAKADPGPTVEKGGPAPAETLKCADVRQTISHLVVVVDATRSMHHPCGDYKRLGIAQWVVSDVLDLAPEDIPTAVLVLQGAVSEKRPLEPLAAGQRTAVRRAMMTLAPHGTGELKECFERVQTLLAHDRNARPLVVVVTDGDDCHPGEAHGTASQLAQTFNGRLVFKLIGVGCDDSTGRQLIALAQAGGGSYSHVRSSGELGSALDSVREECRRFRLAQAERETSRECLITKLFEEFRDLKRRVDADNDELEDVEDAVTRLSGRTAELKDAVDGSTEGLADLKRQIEEERERFAIFRGELLAGVLAQIEAHEARYADLQQTVLTQVNKESSQIEDLQNKSAPALAFGKRLSRLIPESDSALAALLTLLGVGGPLGLVAFGRRGIRGSLSQLESDADGLKDVVSQIKGAVEGGTRAVKEAVDGSAQHLTASVKKEIEDGAEALKAAVHESRDAVNHTVAEKAQLIERGVSGVKEAVEASSFAVNQTVAEKTQVIERGLGDVKEVLGLKIETVTKAVKNDLTEIISPMSESISTHVGELHAELTHSATRASDKLDALRAAAIERIDAAERQLGGSIGSAHADVKQSIPQLRQQVTEAVLVPLVARLGEIETAVKAGDHTIQLHLERKTNDAAAAVATHSERLAGLLGSSVEQLHKEVCECVSIRLDAVGTAVAHSEQTLSGRLEAAEKALSDKIGCSERQVRSAVETAHVDVKRVAAEVTVQFNQEVVTPVTTNLAAAQSSIEGKIHALRAELADKIAAGTSVAAHAAQVIDEVRSKSEQILQEQSGGREQAERRSDQRFERLEDQTRAVHKELSQVAREASTDLAESVATVAQKCDATQKSVDRCLRKFTKELPALMALAMAELRGEEEPPPSSGKAA